MANTYIETKLRNLRIVCGAIVKPVAVIAAVAALLWIIFPGTAAHVAILIVGYLSFLSLFGFARGSAWDDKTETQDFKTRIKRLCLLTVMLAIWVVIRGHLRHRSPMLIAIEVGLCAVLVATTIAAFWAGRRSAAIKARKTAG